MSWYFFKRYLFSEYTGSLTRIISRLCILGVAIAIAAMVVVMSVMGGFGEHIEQRLLNFEPHLILSSNRPTSLERLSELYQIYHQFKNSSETKLFLVTEQEVIGRTVDSFYSGAILRGLESESYKRYMKKVRDESEKQPESVLNWNNKEEQVDSVDELSKDEVVIGADLAHTMGLFIGDRLIVTPPESLLLPPGEVPPLMTFKVVNTIRTNIPEIDTQVVIYNRDKLSKVFREVMSVNEKIEVYVDDLKTLDETKNQFLNLGLNAETWKDRNSTLFYSLKMEKLLIGVFLFLALFIGSFSILTVLLLLATQKKQDIGILKTLGLNGKKTQILFTQIGLYLSLIGVFGGFIVGLLVCVIIDKFPLIELPDVYYDRTIPVRYEFGIYILVLTIAFIITFISSWVPALWGSKTTPTEALRKV